MTNAANGDATNVYLVGHGSFAPNDWSQTGAPQFVEEGSYSVLPARYLTAGDVFKVKNVDNWYGFEKITSGNSLVREAKYNMLVTPDTAKWGTGQSGYYWANYPGVNGGSGYTGTDTGSIDIYLKAYSWWYNNGFNYGGIHYWTGDNEPWLAYSSLSDGDGYKIYANVKNESIEPISVSSINGLLVYRDNGSGHDAESSNFTLSGNGNIVIKTDGFYRIQVDGSGNIGISDPFQHWIDTYLHLNDYSGTEGEDGPGTCSSYYPVAKTALLNLGESAVEFFETNGASNYEEAFKRYNAWARANKDENPFEEAANNGNGLYVDSSLSGSAGMIAMITIPALAAVGGIGYLVMRLRKSND